MDDNKNDDNRFRADMFQRSMRVSSIACETTAPALLGFGLDYFCGTMAVFTILGAAAGLALGFWQLIQIAKDKDGL